MTAEEYLNQELNGCFQTHTNDGIVLITGIEHSEVCEIIDNYHKAQLKEIMPSDKEILKFSKNI